MGNVGEVKTFFNPCFRRRARTRRGSGHNLAPARARRHQPELNYFRFFQMERSNVLQHADIIATRLAILVFDSLQFGIIVTSSYSHIKKRRRL